MLKAALARSEDQVQEGRELLKSASQGLQKLREAALTENRLRADLLQMKQDNSRIIEILQAASKNGLVQARLVDELTDMSFVGSSLDSAILSGRLEDASSPATAVPRQEALSPRAQP